MLSNVGLPVTGERYVDEMYEDESVDLDDLSEMLFRSNFGFEMTALAASIPKASTQGEIRQYLDQACRDFRMSVYRTSITTSRLADLKLMVREFYSRNGNMRPAVLTDLVREVALNAQFMSFAMNANYAPALPTEPEMRRALEVFNTLKGLPGIVFESVPKFASRFDMVEGTTMLSDVDDIDTASLRLFRLRYADANAFMAAGVAFEHGLTNSRYHIMTDPDITSRVSGLFDAPFIKTSSEDFVITQARKSVVVMTPNEIRLAKNIDLGKPINGQRLPGTGQGKNFFPDPYDTFVTALAISLSDYVTVEFRDASGVAVNPAQADGNGNVWYPKTPSDQPANPITNLGFRLHYNFKVSIYRAQGRSIVGTIRETYDPSEVLDIGILHSEGSRVPIGDFRDGAGISFGNQMAYKDANDMWLFSAPTLLDYPIVNKAAYAANNQALAAWPPPFSFNVTTPSLVAGGVKTPNLAVFLRRGVGEIITGRDDVALLANIYMRLRMQEHVFAALSLFGPGVSTNQTTGRVQFQNVAEIQVRALASRMVGMFPNKLGGIAVSVLTDPYVETASPPTGGGIGKPAAIKGLRGPYIPENLGMLIYRLATMCAITGTGNRWPDLQLVPGLPVSTSGIASRMVWRYMHVLRPHVPEEALSIMASNMVEDMARLVTGGVFNLSMSKDI
jgi:hypothetical protein